MTFNELLLKSRKGTTYVPPLCLLALDPGEHTGVAVFKQGQLKECTQLLCKDNPAQSIIEIFEMYQPTCVVCEDYRIYKHKTESHAWSDLFTPRLLGMIELLCYQQEINLHLQMASTAKGFCTPEKLKEWGFWQKGKRHADDAIKHGAYFLLFYGRSVLKRG